MQSETQTEDCVSHMNIGKLTNILFYLINHGRFEEAEKLLARYTKKEG